MCKTSTFYGLLKFVKAKRLKMHQEKMKFMEYIKVKDPFVAGPNCKTSHLSHLSQLLDILLRPLLKHVKRYLRDDIDFLNYLPKHVNEHTGRKAI